MASKSSEADRRGRDASMALNPARAFAISLSVYL